MMNLLEPQLTSQPTPLPTPPRRKDYCSGSEGDVSKDCKADSSSSNNRKRSSSIDLEKEQGQKRRSKQSASREKRTEGIIRELKANRICLKVEISQLQAERDACREENNRLRLLLKDQEQAVQERNQALQLLLQQPGLLLQQQQQGSLLTLPGAPVSVVNEIPAVSDNVSSPPTIQVPVCFLPEQPDGLQATVLLLRPDQVHHQGQVDQQQGVLLQGAPMPPQHDESNCFERSTTPLPFSEFPPDLTSHMHREFQQQHAPSIVSLADFDQLSDSLHSLGGGAADNAQAILQTQQELENIQAQIKEIRVVKNRLKDVQSGQ